MNKEDKETLRLTLMAFESNSSNVRNIRLRNFNNLTEEEELALQKVEQKMNEIKNIIMDVILESLPELNHLEIGAEFEKKSFKRQYNAFLHDNVD